MKRKAQTFHFVEEKQEEEFHLPKFKSDVLKTRDDRDQEFSLGLPERTTAHFKEGTREVPFNKDQELTFREIKPRLDLDDELFHSQVQPSQMDSETKLNELRSNIGLEKEEFERRIEGLKLQERPRMRHFKEKDVMLFREWKFIGFLAFVSGMFALFRFLIDLINS